MKDQAEKAFYAMMGAPVVFRRQLLEMTDAMRGGARKEYEAWAKAGKEVATNIRKSEMVEEISSRMDIDQIQGQVEKLRDQLEQALSHWRESFAPEKPEAKAPVTKAPVTKAPAKKAPAARKAPAKKAPAKPAATASA